jgi:hypothetical protein
VDGHGYPRARVLLPTKVGLRHPPPLSSEVPLRVDAIPN